MEITDVRIKPISDSSERLKAVCTITFDDVFVVRDIKIVDGVNGMFVAMPSRKVSVSCPSCGHKNAIRARYCNECGTRLPSQEASSQDDDGRSKMHRDIAHPITSEFRSMIQSTVIERFENADGEFDQEESTPRGRQQANDSRQAADQTSEQDEYSSIIAELKGGKSRSSSQSDSGSRSRGGRKPRDGRGRSEKGGSRRDRQDQGNRDSQEE
ncbi:MAG: SpoVG family protein [Phycisphaerae bacterium]